MDRTARTTVEFKLTDWKLAHVHERYEHVTLVRRAANEQGWIKALSESSGWVFLARGRPDQWKNDNDYLVRMELVGHLLLLGETASFLWQQEPFDRLLAQVSVRVLCRAENRYPFLLEQVT